MKRIPLNGKNGVGRFAIVDDEDFEWLSQWGWYAWKGRNTLYAARHIRKGGHRMIHMHRLINKTPDHLFTDHRNGDGLDNRRNNLRTATAAQNCANARRRPDSTSGVKGVYFDKSRRKWAADIQCEKMRVRLGRFETKDAAIEAYQTAAKTLFGEFYRSDT